MAKRQKKTTIEDKLYEGCNEDIRKLRKQAKAEHRAQARRDYMIKQRRELR